MLVRTIRSSLQGVKPKQNGVKVCRPTNNNRYSYGRLYMQGVKGRGFVGALVGALPIRDIQPKIINTIGGMSIGLAIGAISPYLIANPIDSGLVICAISPYLIDKVMDSQSSA